MRHILRFDELDSTNAYAKRNCSLSADKTVILARCQNAGRGRLNRKWLSQDGGLYFSLILKPSRTAFLPNLTQLMALSVCGVLRSLGADAWLKWPNDVLADGKKICGILSEAVAGAKGFEALVLGTGINIRQEDLLAAGQPAVSLKMLGINVREEEVLQRVLDAFFEKYEDVLYRGFNRLRDGYLAHFPYVGKEVAVQNGTRKTQGRIKTISPEGRLVLQTPQGLTEISIGDMTV